MVAVSLMLMCLVTAADDPEPNPFGSGWDVPVDPDKDCKFKREKAGLTITVPGKDHDLGVERGKMNSPRVLRTVEGDFVAQVRVSGSFEPSMMATTDERLPFVGAGLLLMVDDKTYIRLERAGLRRDGVVKSYANWEIRRDGKWELAGSADVKPFKEKASYLRLERKGDRILGSVSEDGKTWYDLPSLELKGAGKLKLGVSCGGTSSEPFSPHFDQFKLIAARKK